MKIIGVGLNKTGTTTLGECLKHWNYTHCSYTLKAFHFWRDQQKEELIQFASRFDSFEDWPWPLCYRELDAAFPGSKFILTTRKTPEIWFDSLCKHADRTGPTEFRKVIYGHEMPHNHEKHHLAFYHRHNEEVRNYFAERPTDFIELCWENGHGWKQLSGFLDKPIPTVPFPHANKRPTQRTLLQRVIGKLSNK